MKATNFLIFSLIVGLEISLGQDVSDRFNHLGKDDGLSQNAIYAIEKDSYGFMWFGSKDGLNKYDGYKITTYRHDINNINSLSNNTVLSILEDSPGVLWIGTSGGGLNKFNTLKNEFIHYKNEPNNENSLSQNYVYDIHKDKNGILWIATYGGLNRFDPTTVSFKAYKHNINDERSLSNNDVYSIYEDNNGLLWLATYGGVNSFDPKTETFTRYQYNPESDSSIPDNNIISICGDQFDNIWIGTYRKGLCMLDQRTGLIKKINDGSILSNLTVQSIQRDTNGILWILCDSGLHKFDPATEKILESHVYSSSNKYSIGSNSNYTLYVDDEDLWVGSWTSGVSHLNLKKKGFKHYIVDNYSRVISIYEDYKNNIWLGTERGLTVLYRKTQLLEKIDFSSSFKILNNARIYSIDGDSKGNIWFGTKHGLFKYDPITKVTSNFRHKINDNNSLSDDNVTFVYVDAEDIIWLGTWDGGLNKFDNESNTFEHYTYQTGNEFGISDNNVQYVFEDREGVLWIGTYGGGLNMLNKTTKSFTYYKHNETSKETISDDNVTTIFEDKTGNLWIGTGNGLNKFNREKGSFDWLIERDGLANSFIHSIQEDNNNNLWVSTNKGISKYNTPTGEIKNFDEADGLQGNEFSQASWKDSKGNFYFGGENGFNFFHPDSIQNDMNTAPTLITSFQKYNKEVQLDTPIYELDKLTLSYRDKVFSFEFTSLDYTSPYKNKYAYTIEGFDKDWVYTNAQNRKATYTNLDPGEYTFRVKGSNEDGIWNDEGASLKIIITPPWWETWWFRILAFLSAIGIGILILKKYERDQAQKRKEKELQKELDHKNRELVTYSMGMVSKNSFLNELQEYTNTLLAKHKKSEVAPDLAKIATKIKRNKTSDKDWKEFQLRFIDTHPKLYRTLTENYNLTGNDLKLCAFIRLNFKIKETADLMGISPISLKTARYRLRKKLRLENKDDLFQFLLNIE